VRSWLGANRSVLLGGHPVLALPRLLRGRDLFAAAGPARLLRTTLPPGARVEDAAYPLNIVVTRALVDIREVIRTGNCLGTRTGTGATKLAAERVTHQPPRAPRVSGIVLLCLLYAARRLTLILGSEPPCTTTWANRLSPASCAETRTRRLQESSSIERPRVVVRRWNPLGEEAERSNCTRRHRVDPA
jgi:hypothetical protein